MSIWNILQTFGIFNDYLVHFGIILVHFFRFWYQVPRKILQPWINRLIPARDGDGSDRNNPLRSDRLRNGEDGLTDLHDLGGRRSLGWHRRRQKQRQCMEQ
jgi:hypothetical protein